MERRATFVLGVAIGTGIGLFLRSALSTDVVGRTAYTSSTDVPKGTASNLRALPPLPPLDAFTTPTDQELAQSQVLAENTSRRVVRLKSTGVVVKYGQSISFDEAVSMRFISANTTIPVPKVLQFYEKGDCRYIIMEYIEGDLFNKVWNSISLGQKESIVIDWQVYTRQMRQIPSRSFGIGSVTGGAAIDRRQAGEVTGGPFVNEAEFNSWQLAQLADGVSLAIRDMYTAILRQLETHQVVFTHGDLAAHNIIVRDGRIVGIIDWEYSGWYPEHWDYCKTMSHLGGTEEGYLVCQKVYEKAYHSEYHLDFWLQREFKHGGF